MPRQYYVYILTNRSGTLYVGVTNDLVRRVYQHRDGKCGGFTNRYGIGRLVYCEVFGDVRLAIAREKQIKGWARRKKVALISAANPGWEELLPDLPPEPDPSAALRATSG